MKRIAALLLVFILLLTGCGNALAKESKETVPQVMLTEPEETWEIVPEAAISVPCLTLRVVYTTDTGFVGAVDEEPESHLRDGMELNIVIEEGVKACYWEDETAGSYIDAREVPYEPGMLVIIQYTSNKWIGDTIYPELLDVPPAE